jgi:hypothetical protein
MELPMAVGVQVDFRGVSLEQYDEVAERLGLLFGGPMPRGGLFHWVTTTDDGIRITDVWETRQLCEQFVEESVIPAYREIDVSDPPQIQFFEVHNYLVGGRRR